MVEEERMEEQKRRAVNEGKQKLGKTELTGGSSELSSRAGMGVRKQKKNKK